MKHLKVSKSIVIKNYNTSDEAEHDFDGYLSYYDNKDRDNDVIKKGAFKQCIKNKDRYNLVFQHKDSDLLSIVGTIEVFDTEKGVEFKAYFNKQHPHYNIIAHQVKTGAMSEMSIGFFIESSKDVEYNKDNNGFIFKKAVITEGSIVSVPANPKAQINTIKSFIGTKSKPKKTKEDFKKKLAKIKEKNEF